MQRFPLSVPWKSIANSFWGLRAPEIGHKNGGCMETLRFFGTSEGYRSAISISRPIQGEIVDALHSGDRNRASYLLSKLGGGSHASQAQDFVLILQYCARTPDPLFVMETWRLMEEKDVEFSGRCYFLTIRALCKGGYFEEALNIVSFLEEKSYEIATLPMHNNFLEACLQLRSLNDANECLHLMERQGLGKNEITYALLLKLAVLQQDFSAVKKILKECVNFYSRSILTLRRFVWSFTRLRDLESACAALQQMVAVTFQNDLSITKTAEGKLYNSRLDIPIPCRDKLTLSRCSNNNNNIILPTVAEYDKEENLGKTEQWSKIGVDAEEVRDGGASILQKPICRPVMKLLRWSFNDIIQTCASTKNLVLAEKLITQMQSLGLELSCNSYNGFIRALVSVKGFRDGMEVLKVMQLKNMKPYDSTLAAISTSCSRGLELDLAEIFLDQMSQCPYAYPYNAFLEACDILDRPERALQVLAKMKRLNVLPDIRTYELLFSLFGNVNAPYEDGNIWSQVDVAKRIYAIEMDMTRLGIPHNHLSMQNLLKALGTEGMMKELMRYLHVAENQFHGSPCIGITIYNTVLHSLVEAKESGVAVEIFRDMISCGYSLDAATYDIMIDCCSNIRCYRSACGLVSLMIRDGFCPNAVTYTALIKILLKSEQFDEAIKLLEQCISDGIHPDVVLYNTILQTASKEGQINVIEFIIERMHQEKIQPDPSTCSHVFSAYVDNGFHITAMEALQVLSLRMISLQDDVLEENRLEYENLIFREDLEAESHIIEIFKDSTNLAVALLYLRWCAISSFPISWQPNQSPWATQLSTNYALRWRG